jgi:hypothetical protein
MSPSETVNIPLGRKLVFPESRRKNWLSSCLLLTSSDVAASPKVINVIPRRKESVSED